MRTAIVTTCKGRLGHLERSLPAMLDQRLFGRDIFAGVVLVDYDCPEHCGDWGWAMGAEHLHVVRVTNAPLFRICHAKNVGIRHALECLQAAFVLMIDCSAVLAGPDALADWLLQRTNGATCAEACGTCLINTAAWLAIRGYDESHEGYGHDDTNFQLRLTRAGFCVRHRPVDFQVLPHTDADRERYTATRITPESLAANHAWATDFSRPVNPTGFGRLSRDSDPQGATR